MMGGGGGGGRCLELLVWERSISMILIILRIIISSWACSSKTAHGFVGICSPFVAKSGPTGAEHGARSQLDRYVLFLIQSVIIKREVHTRDTTKNNVIKRTRYIICMHAHCDRARVRNCQSVLSMPQIQFWMIITATWIELVKNKFIIIIIPKIHNFPHGRLFCISHKILRVTEIILSDEIIGQNPVWNIVHFAI